MRLTLTVSNICKSYGGRPVLKGCCFSFEKAGMYVLMGPNGSGKSTFLRICALLEPPDRGEVMYLVGGTAVERDIRLKRRITLLLPGIGIFNTSVKENVAYGLKLRGIRRRQMREKVGKALEFVGLAGKKDQNALTLSSGEMQRLGIARAMVIEPEILFLDEPTASVDEKNAALIEDILLAMKVDERSTVIIATHDMAQARRLGGELLFLEDGRVVGAS